MDGVGVRRGGVEGEEKSRVGNSRGAVKGTQWPISGGLEIGECLGGKRAGRGWKWRKKDAVWADAAMVGGLAARQQHRAGGSERAGGAAVLDAGPDASESGEWFCC